MKASISKQGVRHQNKITLTLNADMMDKVNFVQREGGGVIMATGTPITNSITDAYVLQKYLQSGELALLDLQSFDAWVGMFAERASEFEIDVDTNKYRIATRFSKFHNLPELTALRSSIADFHRVDKSVGIPDFDGYRDVLVGKTAEFTDYLNNISDRADRVRSGAVNRKEDNMLLITTDGRKAALDLRLVSDKARFTYQSKVARCAENVFDIYYKTCNNKGVQLIFCDTSTPKEGFNVYDEMARLLTSQGIPRGEIAYIHDADTERQRAALFAAARRGEIRVLIGSTFKLGLGVNVQDKLIALHHLDIPWRPSDETQRLGRILRQGNENERVFVYRYITEGSFDAYSWQLLETKQRFIAGLLSGSLSDRSGADIENTVLNYAEVKALAIGNPLIKERVETANMLTRYITLQRKAAEMRDRLEKELAELPDFIMRTREFIAKCRADIAHYAVNKREFDKTQRKELRATIAAALADNVLKEQESYALSYQGFDVILPKNMIAEKPYVWVQRNGRYYVEMGESDSGVLIRIDNLLDKLEGHLERLRVTLADACARQIEIKKELSKDEDYADKIESTKDKLKKLDERLGA